MRVLVACEESQTVCKAFRAKGHEAYSNDIQECSGGHPEWHLQMDSLEALKLMQWDMLIGFPPCTYLSCAGMHHLRKDMTRMAKLVDGKEFFLRLWNAPIKKIAIENPTGYMNTNWRKPNQIIHPWYFGDNEMKRTCLWLKGLPRLNGLHHVALNIDAHKPKPKKVLTNKAGRKINVYFSNDMKNIGDSRTRSKFWPTIADAMAKQWG